MKENLSMLLNFYRFCLNTWYFLSLFLFGKKVKTAFDKRNFIEEREIERGFTDFYQKELKHLVEEREIYRVNCLETTVTLLRVSTVFTIMIWTLFLYFADDIKKLETVIIFHGQKNSLSVGDLIYFIFLFAHLATLLPIIPYLKYKDSAKKDLFKKIFSFFPDYFYRPDSKIYYRNLRPGRYRTFIESNLFAKIDQIVRIVGSDYLKIVRKGVSFDFEELSVETVYRTKNGNKIYSPIFQGFGIIVPTNKSFEQTTIIKARHC